MKFPHSVYLGYSDIWHCCSQNNRLKEDIPQSFMCYKNLLTRTTVFTVSPEPKNSLKEQRGATRDSESRKSRQGNPSFRATVVGILPVSL